MTHTLKSGNIVTFQHIVSGNRGAIKAMFYAPATEEDMAEARDIGMSMVPSDARPAREDEIRYADLRREYGTSDEINAAVLDFLTEGQKDRKVN